MVPTTAAPARPATAFHHILCAVDGTIASRAVVDQALALAGPDSAVTVFSASGVPETGLERARFADWHAAAAVSAATGPLGAAGHRVRGVVRHAPVPARGILGAAAGHDLVVVGARDGTWAGGRLGRGTASTVLAGAPAAVLLARGDAGPAWPATVLSVRAGQGDLRTLQVAASVAASRDAVLAQAPAGAGPEAVLTLAGELGARLIVVGGRAGTAGREVGMRIAAGARCSVLVLEPGRRWNPGRVVDGRPPGC